MTPEEKREATEKKVASILVGVRRLFKSERKTLDSAEVPEDLTVSQWADKFRRLSPESSAQAGP